MCNLFACVVFYLLIPLGDGNYERHSYTFDTKEECIEFVVLYVEKFKEEQFDVDKYGKPQFMCIEGMTI